MRNQENTPQIFDTSDIPEAVKNRLEQLPIEQQNRFYRLLQRLKDSAHVKTAAAGTQYVLPIDILLSPNVFQEMEKLNTVVSRPQQAAAGQD